MRKNGVQAGENMGMPTVVSLFAGCGGSSLGYKWAGFRELLAVEWERNAADTFRLNFPGVPVWERDISKLKGQEILDFCKMEEGELDVLDGSPPCQGFSTAGKRVVSDVRNDLFRYNIRLIDEIEPKVFVIENVSGMIKGIMKGRFNGYMRQLKELPYRVRCKLMNAKYYNVPQSRLRLIWVGVRDDLAVEPSYPMPSRELIGIDSVIPELAGRHFITWRNRGRRDALVPASKPFPTLCGRVEFAGRKAIPFKYYKAIQTFPEGFKISCGITKAQVLIGNSVPLRMMEAIAGHVRGEILGKAELARQCKTG